MICNKIKHKDYAGAIKHIIAIKKKKGCDAGAYYCASCNAYHITSKISGNSKFVKFK